MQTFLAILVIAGLCYVIWRWTIYGAALGRILHTASTGGTN